MLILDTLQIALVTNNDKSYSDAIPCECCGEKISPTKQPNGVNYYYEVSARAIDPKCLGVWLGKIGSHIATDPHPYWLDASLNREKSSGK